MQVPATHGLAALREGDLSPKDAIIACKRLQVQRPVLLNTDNMKTINL